jgi:hypothetical protein
MRFLLAVLLLTGVAGAEGVTILGHDITITLDPKASTLDSTDRVRVRGPGTLRPETPEGVTAEPASVEVPEGEHTVSIRFRGTVKAPVKRAEGATWVAGDRSAGTIGERGSYLFQGFYVASPKPSPFRVSIRVPLPHRAVAPGRRSAESEEDGQYAATFATSYAIDRPVIVTGPWVVDEKKIDGVSCRTYLLEQDRKFAPLLLGSLEQEIPRFQKLLGPVPDGRFDVVSNFFATGYGFPNFTLLGETVIRYVSSKALRERRTALPAGYLDHELVHCWLGNYVGVDYEKGNWCEALTTWYANYGSAVRDKTDAEYRRKVSRTFSLRVYGERDYPLGDFKSKRHDFENDIGYGKGSMVFHMLEREIGQETLHTAVRHAIAKLGGKEAGWATFVAALSEGADRDLTAWFKPWLERRGAPVLRWGEVSVDGAIVTGTILQTQEGPAFPLRIPIVAETEGGREERVVTVAAKETVIRVAFEGTPKRLLIDPDHHVFRKVRRADVAPCLEAVTTADKKVGFGEEALLKRLKIDAGAAGGLPKDAALFAVGLPDALRAEILAGARRQDGTFKVREGAFEFRGATYDKPDDGILMTYARPEAPGFPVSFFHGNAEPAFARTRYIPYYAAWGWVVFRGGRPVARGNFDGDRGTRRTVTENSAKTAGSFVSDLLLLTHPKWKGRRAGTPEAYRLGNELRGRLFRTDAEVLAWPGVSVVDASIPTPPTLAVGKDGKPEAAAYYPFYWSGPAAGGVVCPRVVEHPAEAPAGALVLLPEVATYDMMKRYADAGAGAVAVIATDETLKGRGREAAWLDWMPPSVSTKGRNANTTVSGLRSRSAHEPLKIPAIYAAPAVVRTLRAAKGPVRLEYRVKLARTTTSNLVGVFGKGKTPCVLLSAHWDGVGLIDGQPSTGAADNAAGVAVVLWVADQLKRDADAGRLKKPVVVCLFGGEEGGLLGSRQFARALFSAQSPIAKPVAMLNVDGIGGGKDDKVYVIGRTFHPALLETLKPHLEKEKLALGRDIDKFAYPYGSDHWPLHEAGVPAVTLYGTDYRAMNSARDTLDKVDVSMLRRVARAVYRTVRELAE